ncbi:MAG: hypothetical protein ACI87J_001649 [Colwellia sp.]|jgi:hypothetical protein
MRAVPQDLTYLFDREDMLELLGKIFDNAYKWAEKTILVTISQT